MEKLGIINGLFPVSLQRERGHSFLRHCDLTTPSAPPNLATPQRYFHQLISWAFHVITQVTLSHQKMYQSQILSKKNFTSLVQIHLGAVVSVLVNGFVLSRPTWKGFVMSFFSFTSFIWLDGQCEDPREISHCCSLRKP